VRARSFRQPWQLGNPATKQPSNPATQQPNQEFDSDPSRLYTPQTLMNTNFAHAPHHQHHHHVM